MDAVKSVIKFLFSVFGIVVFILLVCLAVYLASNMTDHFPLSYWICEHIMCGG